jgi:demethylmenaquinone methyltransferase/2-methoxy-6-polyprenyl-1,4-benzoquinol methylase
MANDFYDPGEHRAARVRELFTHIAPRYDLINDLQSFGLHRYWKRCVIRLANPQSGELALDLCCGTGDLALALAERGVNVLGLDFTDRMLDAAERRKQHLQRSGPAGLKPSATPRSALRTPHFVQGDALRTPFTDRSFDIVTVGYGLRNLADPKDGLREMKRVAKAGGRLLVLDFGKPDNRLWRSFYFGYLKLFVPLLGRLFCGKASAYAYILESLKHYPAQRGVAAQMQELGLNDIRIINLLGGVMSINYATRGE